MASMTLGEVADRTAGLIQTGPFGSQLHAADYTASGVAVVMPQDIRDGYVDHSSIAHVPSAIARALERHRLIAGDLVYSRRGDVEKCAFVREQDLPALCGTGCLLVRTADSDQVVNRFLAYFLRTPSTRAWVRGHAVGATMLNLNTSILRAVPVNLPPLGEQQAIAEVLGTLDDKIAANTELVATCLDLSRALHARVLQQETTSDTPYTDVASVGGGATPSTKRPEYWDGDIPWAAPSDITALAAPYLDDTPRHITAEGFAACSSPLYPVGSILMTSRATIGAFAVNQVPTAVNQGFIVVTPHADTHRWWLLHEMERRVPEYLNRANGATFLELPRGVFKTMHFDLPDAAVLERFHEQVDPIHARALAATRESRTLAELRDALLPALMDGTIKVKDAVASAEEVL